MRESALYLQFLQRNLLIFSFSLYVSLAVCIYLFALEPVYHRISQTYKLTYKLDNLDQILALTDQAVTELRSQDFAEGVNGASVIIYKSSPFNITVEATSKERDRAYSLLIKEAEYLRQNFMIQELTSPEISAVEPSLFRYVMSGVIIGGILGLVTALGREYLKNY